MACERVEFVGKTREQISHHRKDGVTEAITVIIYAREEVFKVDDRTIWRTCKVFGIHVEG